MRLSDKLTGKCWYKWVVVACCFLMTFVALGFCSSSKGLYLKAITDALGIKRSLFSLNDTFRYVTSFIVNLLFGPMVARFGTKKLIAAGYLSLILSTFLYSIANSVVLFYIGGIFLGLGLSWTSTSIVGSIVHKWFPEHAGKIMGLILCSNGLGAALATQIVSPIIEESVFGYRNAYRLVIVLLAATLALLLVFFHDKPQTQTAAGKKKAVGRWEGLPYSEALKKPYFYFTLVCVFVTGMILQGLVGINAAHMRDVGLDAEYVALIVSVHAVTLALFKFLTGLLHDRFGLRATLAICNITAVIVTVMLAVLDASPLGQTLAMLYGIFSSLAIPLETVMVPLVASNLFGSHSYDKLLGILVSVCSAGCALGAPLLNWVYDTYGSYQVILLIFAGLMTAVTVGYFFILNAAKRLRDQNA